MQNWLIYDISITSFLLVLLCGLLVGMAKTGLPGAGLAVVPIMAGIFGGKSSTGLLLLILVMADIFAVKYYNRHASWKYILKLLPWAFIGILIGAITGQFISENLFNRILSVLVILGILLMIWQDIIKNKINIPDYWLLAPVIGLAGGFSTMIGNAAGSIMALYLLAMRLPKNIFIGTAAWFFLIINVSKIPLHIFYWKTINLNSFLFDLYILPAIITGVFVGIKVVKLFSEKLFKMLIILATLFTAIFLLITSIH